MKPPQGLLNGACYMHRYVHPQHSLYHESHYLSTAKISFLYWEERKKLHPLLGRLMCLFILCCRGFAGAWPGKGAHDQAEGRTVCFETRRRGTDKIQVLSAKLLSESAHALCPNPRPCPLGSCEVRGAQVPSWDLSFFELVNVAENGIAGPSLKRMNVGVRGGGLGLCK